MGSEAPGADAAQPQMDLDSQDAGTSQTEVAEDMTPNQQLQTIAEGVGGDGNTDQSGSPVAQSSGKNSETQAHIDVDSKDTKDTSNGPSTEIPSENSPNLSPDMERYRRMEAVLLKHRKEWESNHESKCYARATPGITRSDPHFGLRGPWNETWNYMTVPHYRRPNPFELTNEHKAFPYPHHIEEKDEFDLAIDYGAARNRLRKNFEWELDRLF
ncbi:hypothetical protein PG997_014346 [Apiospora hydei]|uniref:Uncharacterized protein n=1 Tax=Apiospora hydei TaxID=1337664 RepID=A0ABR1UTI5_9PEZI